MEENLDDILSDENSGLLPSGEEAYLGVMNIAGESFRILSHPELRPLELALPLGAPGKNIAPTPPGGLWALPCVISPHF